MEYVIVCGPLRCSLSCRWMDAAAALRSLPHLYVPACCHTPAWRYCFMYYTPAPCPLNLLMSQPPFSPNSWGTDGLSALMAAAHRGALGALDALLDCGATVNLGEPDRVCILLRGPELAVGAWKYAPLLGTCAD